MLTRSIDLDETFELTFEEKLFLNAKRFCIACAVAALIMSALDLMNARALGSGAGSVQRIRIASLARAIDTNSFAAASPSVTVTIPTEVAAAAAPITALAEAAAPVTDLAATGHRDAVEFAMLSPPTIPPMPPSMLPPPAEQVAEPPPPAAAPAQPAVKLASISPAELPQAAPIEAAVVLPPTISVLPLRPPPLSPAQRLYLQGTARAKAESCLSKAIYFEARDQPFRGQVAVAQVVMNRVFSGIYPRDVCGVIYRTPAIISPASSPSPAMAGAR